MGDTRSTAMTGYKILTVAQRHAAPSLPGRSAVLGVRARSRWVGTEGTALNASEPPGIWGLEQSIRGL